MRYAIAVFSVILTMVAVACTEKKKVNSKMVPYEGKAIFENTKKTTDVVIKKTTTVKVVKKTPYTWDNDRKVATTVVFRKLPLVLDLPSENFGDIRFAKGVNDISPVSDELLSKGIFTDPIGFLENPSYNNWKTVGPMHSRIFTATLVEAKFVGPKPLWYRYKYANEIMDSGDYDYSLGFHDLVNLVAKYGDELPSDVPIIGFGSVTAYRSFSYMNNGVTIQPPVVIKINGKWEIMDLRIVCDGFSPKDHAPLFLVDIDNTYHKYQHRAIPKNKIPMFLNKGDLLDR